MLGPALAVVSFTAAAAPFTAALVCKVGSFGGTKVFLALRGLACVVFFFKMLRDVKL